MNNREITFLICGLYHSEHTQRCISSIKKYFPGSSIIISTWDDQELPDLEVDSIVYSKDPGSINIPNTDKQLNTNRQLVTLKNGIKKVSTKYVVKIRTDVEFTGSRLLKYIEVDVENAKPHFLSKKICTVTFTSVYKLSGHLIGFHFCDWILTGYTREFKYILDNVEYCDEYNVLKEISEKSQKLYITPEIYLHVSIFRIISKKKKISWRELFSDKLRLESNYYMQNYLIMLDFSEIDILPLKYPNYRFNMRWSYTHLSFIFPLGLSSIMRLSKGIFQKVRNKTLALTRLAVHLILK